MNPSTIRPTAAHIDLSALAHNLAVVRGRAPGAAVCAVVKANAYGHGLVPVGRALESAGISWLAVALVEEGLRLREAGVRAPVLVLSAAFGNGGYDAMLTHNLVPAIGSFEQLAAYVAAARDRPARLHLKIDTGMARLGFATEEMAELGATLGRLPNVSVEAALTHFANADLADREFNTAQVQRFAAALAVLAEHGVQPKVRHIANSAAVLSFAEAHGSLVRPGLMLYGLTPLVERARDELRPVMRLVSRGVHVKTVPAGTRVSYGGRFTTQRPSRLLTLPIGYADGYPRSMSGKAFALVRGKRLPVVGTICMDLCMLDVTDVPEATLEDEVVLLGESGAERITAYDWAEWAGTIPYEIVCGIQDRVPRLYT